MASPIATVAVISIGDMGVGIAKLLKAHNFRVITNISDRSDATKKRAADNDIITVSSDAEINFQADYILSIVPPRDAVKTAQRFIDIWEESQASRQSSNPPYFLELNAVAPNTSRRISHECASFASGMRFLDGGIIGGPPRLRVTDQKASSENDPLASLDNWYRPNIPVSGPHTLAAHPAAHAQTLARVLNIRHISNNIGAASGLKMCFASMTKGVYAIGLQAFTTASRLGVVDELQQLVDRSNPEIGKEIQRALVSFPPKAYRWVGEMDEIAATFKTDGGFDESESIFEGVARTYQLVADETELGSETVTNRRRGTTIEDVMACMTEGLRRREGDGF